MVESPRPQDLGDQRTPVGPEPAETELSAADPRSEPGADGFFARYRYAIIVIGFLIFALIALYFAWLRVPPQ